MSKVSITPACEQVFGIPLQFCFVYYSAFQQAPHHDDVTVVF